MRAYAIFEVDVNPAKSLPRKFDVLGHLLQNGAAADAVTTAMAMHFRDENAELRSVQVLLDPLSGL